MNRTPNIQKGPLKNLILLVLLIFASHFGFSNNATVSNLALTGQNTTADYTMIQFDLTWENSWRTSTGPANWDACWVFAKYRKQTQTTWNHAILSTVSTNHLATGSSAISATADGMGAFVYSSIDISSGTVSYTGLQLMWNYGLNGLLDNDSVEICVYAVEMVYVPQGNYRLGDGSTTTVMGNFRAGTSTAPFLVTSEAAITLGGGGAGSLGNNNASVMQSPDDFNNTVSQTLPAAFPKGWAAFYCMKYPITQYQYVEFLNKLTRAQQAGGLLIGTSIPTTATTVTNRYVLSGPSGSTAIANRNGIRCNGTIAANVPITFYCDLDGDGIPNEVTDGLDIACNWLCWQRISAFLDWSGLRPMTELEYEKACRGTAMPVPNEYAWGTATFINQTGITNAGMPNEAATPAGAQSSFGSIAAVNGPSRVGCYGAGANTRVATGATFYGIMNMTGNVNTKCISVGHSSGRAFNGSHGDGNLLANGGMDVATWPAIATSFGIGIRGGSWFHNAIQHRVSSRDDATMNWSNANNRFGGRGVRTAP